MTFFPSLGTLPLLDGAIQTGRGISAAVLGQTYNVQRMSYPTPATGSITSQDPVFTGFPARLRRTTAKIAIENDIFALICFEAMCDNRSLELMDVMTETGYEAEPSGVFTFAQARPTRETLWMRTEFNVAITRPAPTAGQMSQQPSSGWAAAPNINDYGGIGKDYESVLTLNSGNYAFSTDGASPASIQCGLQPLNKIKDTSSSVAAGEMPVSLYREMFLLYCPLLPGETINELDRFNFPNSDRYEVAVVYTSEDTGLAGYTLIAEKMST